MNKEVEEKVQRISAESIHDCWYSSANKVITPEVVLEGSYKDEVDALYDLFKDMHYSDINREQARSNYMHTRKEYMDLTLEELDLGEIQHIESEGGDEGEGEHVHVVIYLPKYNMYFKAIGRYYSYSGIESFQPWVEVKPQTIEKVIYVLCVEN